MRYDEDDQTTVDQLNPGPTAASATFDKLQPKVQISRRWAERFMGYLTYSEGFRSGGFTQNELFDNEETSNYEVGFKGEFLGGRLLANASLFRVNYVNQQLSFVIFDEGTAQRGVLNLSKTSINGLEFEAAARATPNLQLNLGLGYTDSEIEAADTAALIALGIDAPVSGNRSPLVPKLTLNAAATYTLAVGAGSGTGSAYGLPAPWRLLLRSLQPDSDRHTQLRQRELQAQLEFLEHRAMGPKSGGRQTRNQYIYWILQP